MGLAQYQIVSQGDEWGILHDGDVKNTYATKEAAFEAAVAAASPSAMPAARSAKTRRSPWRAKCWRSMQTDFDNMPSVFANFN